jgi:hypothetical protein
VSSEIAKWDDSFLGKKVAGGTDPEKRDTDTVARR